MATTEFRGQGDAAPSLFNPLAIALPDKFDFRQPESWKRWLTRWEQYRVVSGLHKQDAETQINTLLYAMGSEAEDVLISMRLSDGDSTYYERLTAAFDRYFLPSRNVIYERARFNQRRQQEHEPVEAFVTELHRLAETCDYGALKDELIRDRIVVGLRDRMLSERLQLDTGLTLEKAVSIARNSEVVKSQQDIVRANGTIGRTTFDAVASVG